MKKSSENSMLPQRGQEWIPEKFVSFFSEEGYMWDIASGTKFRGKAIGDSIAALASAFPDVRREILSIYVAENVVVVEHRIRGTHKGELALGSKNCRSHGQGDRCPCADIFRLENGKSYPLIATFAFRHAATTWPCRQLSGPGKKSQLCSNSAN